jgi:Bacterial regulatory helix-turn-helix protein, lysR family
MGRPRALLTRMGTIKPKSALGLIRIAIPARTTVRCSMARATLVARRESAAPERRSVLLDIELRHLDSVIVVAEEMHFTRHFTRASHRLRIAQPSLSKKIQQIERLYGAVFPSARH